MIRLLFIPASGSNRTYLAEVDFYGDGSACPPETIVTTVTIPPTDTTTPPPPDTSIPDTTQEIAVGCKVCPSCSTSIVLASVITVIAAGLLTAGISVLVMVFVYKCHARFTRKGDET